MATNITINREILYYIMRECADGDQREILNTLLRQQMQDNAKAIALQSRKAA